MDCNRHCQNEINNIHQNNEKMNEIENKGKNRTYTKEELNDYKKLLVEFEKLEFDRQLCMNDCEERKRRHLDDATEKRTSGGRRSLSRKVRPNIKRRQGTRRNIRRSTRDRK